jgi:hypothetical protein
MCERTPASQCTLSSWLLQQPFGWTFHRCDERHMRSDNGRLILQTFEEMAPEYYRISDLKKIDFVLWQSRAE